MNNFALYVLTHYGRYIKRIATDKKGNTNTYKLNDTYVTVQYKPSTRKYIVGVSEFYEIKGHFRKDVIIDGLTRQGVYNVLVLVEEICEKEWQKSIKSEYGDLTTYLNRFCFSPEYIKEKNRYKKEKTNETNNL